jgi:hypothetical protein
MLDVGSKIKMVKPVGCCNMTGCDFVVTEVLDDMITFRSRFGIGYMSEDEYSKHFIELREGYCRM